MPNYYCRLNLAAAIFPFYSDAAGRTIIIPQYDENFDRYNAANTTPDKGVAQVFYMHNVMPIAGGFQSIGYEVVIPGLPGNTSFDDVYTLYSANAATVFFVPAGGLNYIFDGSVGTWVSVSPVAGVTNDTLVSVVYIQGVSYIFYEGIGCFTYNLTTRLLDAVTLSGLTISDIIGITTANGYMIAWDVENVSWSNPAVPTDFNPSIQTGAGGGQITDARGPIRFVIRLPDGMVVVCEKNIVGGTFTNNSSVPWIFKEVEGSGGIDNIMDVAYQGNLPYLPAMTSAGIQQISITQAIPTMPEVSDFLTSGIYDDFDDTTQTFSSVKTGAVTGSKYASISNRFIVISYGLDPPNYTYAIVYDVSLNRYGKLKLDHRCAFAYTEPQPSGELEYLNLQNTYIQNLGQTTYADFLTALDTTVIPKQNLAFLQADGTVQLVDFGIGETDSNGTFIIGKYQHQRNMMITHQVTEVETIEEGTNFTLAVMATLNGKDFLPAVPTIPIAVGSGILTTARAARVTGKNISLLLQGNFNLTSMILKYTVSGFR